MKNDKKYSIHELDANITNILGKIVSADILGNIKNGLCNEIEFKDEGSHITDVAEIVSNNSIIKNGTKAYVKLSVAYCQFLWLIDDIALKTIDFKIIQEECNRCGIDMQTYKESSQYIIDHPSILNELSSHFWDIDMSQYYEYLKRSVKLLDENFYDGLKSDYELANTLIDKSKEINLDDFSKIQYSGLYEQCVNSVYCYGIAFILLHELSHFELKHFDKEAEMQDEINADSNAFWNLYSDLDGREQFSANIGILCALFSIFFLNPKMEEDGLHPWECERIFDVYENIKIDNNKYSVLVIKLFELWAEYKNIKDFPYSKEDEEIEVSILNIRNYLTELKKNLNE